MNLLTKISISVLCWCEKVFIHMNEEMIEGNLMRYYTRKRRFLYSLNYGF